MALALVNCYVYQKVKDLVPDHGEKIVEHRTGPGRVYYADQMVLNPSGDLVAMHDVHGLYWADKELVEQLTLARLENEV